MGCNRGGGQQTKRFDGSRATGRTDKPKKRAGKQAILFDSFGRFRKEASACGSGQAFLGVGADSNATSCPWRKWVWDHVWQAGRIAPTAAGACTKHHANEPASAPRGGRPRRRRRRVLVVTAFREGAAPKSYATLLGGGAKASAIGSARRKAPCTSPSSSGQIGCFRKQ